MTSRRYNAIASELVIELFASGHDEPSRRANAIATFRELWPGIKLLRLETAGDW